MIDAIRNINFSFNHILSQYASHHSIICVKNHKYTVRTFQGTRNFHGTVFLTVQEIEDGHAINADLRNLSLKKMD